MEHEIKPIDGNALITWIKESMQQTSKVKAIIAKIKTMPTIDTISVGHGKWVEKEVLEDTIINEWQSARCSECGKYHTTPYMYYFDNFKFCPNCGADMRGTNNARHNINAK